MNETGIILTSKAKMAILDEVHRHNCLTKTNYELLMQYVNRLECEINRLRNLCVVRVLCGGCGKKYTYNRADDPTREGDYGHGIGKCVPSGV